jgi:hypothetical protein
MTGKFYPILSIIYHAFLLFGGIVVFCIEVIFGVIMLAAGAAGNFTAALQAEWFGEDADDHLVAVAPDAKLVISGQAHGQAGIRLGRFTPGKLIDAFGAVEIGCDNGVHVSFLRKS